MCQLLQLYLYRSRPLVSLLRRLVRLLSFSRLRLQLRFLRGCEKFVPAVAYLLFLALPGSRLARFAYLLAVLCGLHELPLGLTISRSLLSPFPIPSLWEDNMVEQNSNAHCLFRPLPLISIISYLG